MTVLDFQTSKPPNPPPASSVDPLDPEYVLETAIEDERTRLLKADSLLGCLQIALDPDAPEVADAYLPYVVEMARELIAESLRRLDFVHLQQLVHEAIHRADNYER